MGRKNTKEVTFSSLPAGIIEPCSVGAVPPGEEAVSPPNSDIMTGWAVLA